MREERPSPLDEVRSGLVVFEQSLWDALPRYLRSVDRALRARGIRDLTVYSAAPNHEIEEALEHRVSPVRLLTLIGGLAGCTAGFAMTIWMSYDWPLIVGGKPIAAIPPYVVIGFELTILMGALSTVAAVALFSVLMGNRGAPSMSAGPRHSASRPSESTRVRVGWVGPTTSESTSIGRRASAFLA